MIRLGVDVGPVAFGVSVQLPRYRDEPLARVSLEHTRWGRVEVGLLALPLWMRDGGPGYRFWWRWPLFMGFEWYPVSCSKRALAALLAPPSSNTGGPNYKGGPNAE